MTETILIVDDEDSVRKTFADWLNSSSLGCEVFSVGDSEAALLIANEHPIDLAILDWNLGTGSDGLRLLEDLVEFHPDIVAILVTGYAHQATPLQALRMGVRDYLDKNQDLNRESFLNAVSRQLNRIIPAKQQRLFNQRLLAFRESIEKILPLVQTTSSLNDPIPFSEAIRSLLRFTQRSTQAQSGVLWLRHTDANGKTADSIRDMEGNAVPLGKMDFGQSLAATALSMQEGCILNDLQSDTSLSMQLQAFEVGKQNALICPIPLGHNMQGILELFDKPGGFTDADKKVAQIATELGSSLLQHRFAERQTQSLLFEAVATALNWSNEFVVDPSISNSRISAPVADQILDGLKQGLSASPSAVMPGADLVELAEAIRVLAVRHGTPAIKHCLRLIESLRTLLDDSYSGIDE